MPTNSAPNSPSSDTDVKSRQLAEGRRQQEQQPLIQACAAAVDELAKSRLLIDALASENAALKTRIETEKKATAILSEINETRKSEADALHTAVAAKNETIAAKDTVIAAQDKLIDTLKHKKSLPWQRIGDAMIGAAAALILR